MQKNEMDSYGYTSPNFDTPWFAIALQYQQPNLNI
jgi:hypothetical protein